MGNNAVHRDLKRTLGRSRCRFSDEKSGSGNSETGLPVNVFFAFLPSPCENSIRAKLK